VIATDPMQSRRRLAKLPRYASRMAKLPAMEAQLMTEITLSATPKGNGYQATVAFSHGVSISSAETYPSIADAMTAAALKLLDMPERLEALDRSEKPLST
jgi:hypothetical protein